MTNLVLFLIGLAALAAGLFMTLGLGWSLVVIGGTITAVSLLADEETETVIHEAS